MKRLIILILSACWMLLPGLAPSRPAVAAGRFHVALLVNGSSGSVTAGLTEVVHLSATLNRKPTSGETLQIRDGNAVIATGHGKTLQVSVHRLEPATARYQAALVDAHNKALTKSSLISVAWKQLSLALKADSAAPGQATGDGAISYAGLPITLSLTLPDGRATSWAQVEIRMETSTTPTTVTSCSAFPCTATQTADTANVTTGDDVVNHYTAVALDAAGKVMLSSSPVSATWQAWKVVLLLNSQAVNHLQVDPNASVALEAITVPTWTSVPSSSPIRLHIGVVTGSGTNSIIDCLPGKRCTTVVPPPVTVSAVRFQGWVTDSATASPTTLRQTGWGDVLWQPRGYQFGPIQLSYTTQYVPCVSCTSSTTVKNSVTMTAQGFVCGDPYVDKWDVHEHIDVSGTQPHVADGTDHEIFDPTTGEPPAREITNNLWVYNHSPMMNSLTLDPYTHFKVIPRVGLDNKPVPYTVEFSYDIPDSIASPTSSPTPGGGVGPQFTLSPAHQVVSVPVSIKEDCP